VSRLPCVVAFLAGAAAVLGFSPFDFFSATLLAFACLIHLWLRAATPRAAFNLGFFFGLGLYAAGVSWVYISLHRFGAMPMPLAAVATLLFCAFLALFPALAGWLQARIARDGETPLALRAALLIPAAWVLTEWSLSWVFTGFPWLALGYSQLDGPLAALAPWVGVYGIGALMVFAVAYTPYP
jgi:apolipoprotein N-acyltransferase